jgi:hypothetical protein
MRQYLVTKIFIFFFMASKSQTNTYDSVVNRLQFHVFTDNVDTCIFPFLKRCVPVLASEPKPSGGGWTMYPPGPVPTPQDGLLSIKVAQHPALQSKHSGARFDILTQEWEDGRPGIRALRVWFYFDRKIDAETALKTLVNMFKAANTKTKVVRHPESQTAMLYEKGEEDWISAKLILQKGKENNPKFNILFTYGSDSGEPW